MSGQGGVIDFDIEFEIFVQSVITQEPDNRFGIEIVLVLGRFHRFGFDEEGSLETFGTGIITRFGKHHGQVFLFAFHVGIQQRHISFATTPEHIVFAAQLNGGVNGILNLGSGKKPLSGNRDW